MITYVNSSFGVRILLRFHGSALWKSLLPALISTIIYFGIFYLFPGGENGLGLLFLHPYPMQAVVTAFTFLLVFRANYRYDIFREVKCFEQTGKSQKNGASLFIYFFILLCEVIIGGGKPILLFI